VPYAENGFLDSCFIDRYQHKDVTSVANTLKKYLLFPSFVGLTIVILGFFLLALIKRRVITSIKDGVRILLFFASWYYCSFSLVTFLKISMNDTFCNVHPNSVSGHFNFVAFSLLSVYSASLIIGWRDKSFMIFYSIYSLVAAFLMADTFFDGYHSLR